MATPELFRVPVPKVAGPSLKVTVPVGVTAEVMVAVKVTDWLRVEGFTLELTEVDVDAFVTVKLCSTDAAAL